MKRMCILCIVIFGLGGCAELKRMNFNSFVNETREIKSPIKIYGQKLKIKIKSGKIALGLKYKF